MSGDVGLAISSSMVLTGMLQLGVRQSAEVASNMTSVERVLQYTKLENEEDLNPTPRKAPDSKWPHSGRIVFKNTFLWYSKQESPVLKNLNISIEAGEKVNNFSIINIFLYFPYLQCGYLFPIRVYRLIDFIFSHMINNIIGITGVHHLLGNLVDLVSEVPGAQFPMLNTCHIIYKTSTIFVFNIFHNGK